MLTLTEVRAVFIIAAVDVVMALYLVLIVGVSNISDCFCCVNSGLSCIDSGGC